MVDLNRIEQDIRDIYRWWAEQSPGVTPREEGVLGSLWKQADEHYGLTPE